MPNIVPNHKYPNDHCHPNRQENWGIEQITEVKDESINVPELRRTDRDSN